MCIVYNKDQIYTMHVERTYLDTGESSDFDETNMAGQRVRSTTHRQNIKSRSEHLKETGDTADETRLRQYR